MDTVRHRADPPVAQRPSVHGGDEEHAAGRAGAERLVRVAQLVCGDIADLGRDAELVRDLEHRQPGDPLEHVRRRRLQDSVMDGEHVEPGALCDQALSVREHDVVTSDIVRGEQRLLEVEPVVVLDARVDGPARDSLGATDNEPEPTLALLRRGQPDVRDREAVHLVLASPDVTRTGRSKAPRRHDLDVCAREARAAHAVRQQARQPFPVDRQAQPQLLDAPEEAVEVPVQAEELAVPHRNDVVGRIGAQEAEVEDRHPRLPDRHELAVDVCHTPGQICRGSALRLNDRLRFTGYHASMLLEVRAGRHF